MTSTTSGAGHPRDFNSLTYRDPTGDAAIRALMGRTVQVAWEDGFIVYLNSEDLKPMLAQLNFRMSRKGHIWGHKKNAPEAAATARGDNQHHL